MTNDELMKAILEILPDALFDEEPERNEIIIATGVAVTRSGLLTSIES